jgi:UPF0755 protein
MRLVLKLLASLVLLAMLALAGAAWWIWSFASSPLELRRTPIEVTLRPGSSVRTVARDLAQAGIDLHPLELELVVRALGKGGEIKAGTYQIAAPITPLELIDKLVRGDVLLTEVVLIEGWTFRQFRNALAASPTLRHDTSGLGDAEVMKRIGAEGQHPEGRFFPDTYRFAKGTSDLEVLKRAYQQMETKLAAAWAARDPKTPLRTPYEALILASIVEKETGQAADRGLVASVFANRLRSGMLLQTDPTVIYGLGEKFDGNLRKRDLTTDGPYNTYTRGGLPPTPIAMPGEASLQAAVKPDASEAFYFVARGDGTSVFSKTLDEHNRAVARFQKAPRAAGAAGQAAR